jgi:hypothetical protein
MFQEREREREEGGGGRQREEGEQRDQEGGIWSAQFAKRNQILTLHCRRLRTPKPLQVQQKLFPWTFAVALQKH